MNQRNYARNLKTNAYVFFDAGSLPPNHVKEHPEQWALWERPDSVIAFRLIGEGTDDYCMMFGHIPKACKFCRGPQSHLINRNLSTFGTKENPSPAYLAQERERVHNERSRS